MKRLATIALLGGALIAPADAAAVQLVVPTPDQRVSATPVLGWQPAAGEISVRVAVYREEGRPETSVFSADLAPDQISVEVQPALARGRYYWVVQGAIGSTATFSPEGTFVVAPGDPCMPRDPALRCPDLVMARPRDVYIDRSGGRRLLRSRSSLDSVGSGPIELRGTRISEYRMRVTQVIHRRGGRPLRIRTRARLGFKKIPGQGGYWKMRDPARLRILSRRTGRTVRVSPKLYYCLRDLRLTRRGLPGAPRRRHYPGCSQRENIRGVTLGTSVGWSDIYPAPYHEQWVDVTGLRGRYILEHVADPLDHLFEEDESNNASRVVVSLPSGRVVG